MRISCIIPAFNEERLIGGCIDSIIRNSHGRVVEIIVIDNASSDRTADVARQKPGVKVVREEQKGLGYARERGRRASVGDFLAYIDADSRMPEGWMSTVEQEFRDHPDAVCLSGPPIYFDATPLQSLLLQVLWWALAPLAYRAVGYMVYGAHFVVKRRALDAIGGFNCAIDFYGEDTDTARRLRKIGNVIFRVDFRIITSARRFQAQGVLATSLIYGLNFLWPAIFGRAFSMRHTDVR